MNALDAPDRVNGLNRPNRGEWSGWNLAAFAVAVAGAFALVAPHLRHPLWQDEVKTLVMFASDGLLHPFRSYQIPNNHVLFSAALSLWSEGVDSVAGLRALPAAAYLCSAVLLGVCVGRYAGAGAGVFATLLFGTSHVAHAFAAQLRGYGFSWLPIVAACCALQPFLTRGGWRRGLAYVAAAAASVAVLPTNAVIVSVLGVHAVAMAALEGRLCERATLGRVGVALLAPLAGALAYLGVLPQLLAATAEIDYSPWTLSGMAGHWLWATCVDFAWLAPLALLGAAVTFHDAVCARGEERDVARRVLVFAVACLAVPALGFALLPQLPYARNLVPLLPLWYAALGFFLAVGWRLALARCPRARGPAQIALVLAVVAAATGREAGELQRGTRAAGPELVQDLYHQYYHHAFDPVSMARQLEEIASGSQAVFLTDFNGEWAVGFETARRYGGAARARIVHFLDADRGLPGRRGRVPIYVLTHHLERAREIARHHGLPAPRERDLVVSTGFFKLFRIPDAASGRGAGG